MAKIDDKEKDPYADCPCEVKGACKLELKESPAEVASNDGSCAFCPLKKHTPCATGKCKAKSHEPCKAVIRAKLCCDKNAKENNDLKEKINILQEQLSSIDALIND